jgi:hypothetical protein
VWRGGLGGAYLLLLLDPAFFGVTSFCTPAVRCCTLALGRGKPRGCSFPSIEFQSGPRPPQTAGGHRQTALPDARRAPCLPDANKRVSFVMTDAMLRANGYFLDVEPFEGHKLITEAMEKNRFRFPMIRDW